MKQTPVHEIHNADLLALMPAGMASVVEIGCSSGALAREYKKANPGCRYTGVEIDADYGKLAERYCDRVLVGDVESMGDDSFRRDLSSTCWVFGDTLEHFRDPWRMLERVRKVIPDDGCVVACIPNAQHYSVQAKLNSGNLWYEDSGLLDRTHLRWFTRLTIDAMFRNSGFQIVNFRRRVFQWPGSEVIIGGVRAMAAATGGDEETAVADAMTFQYLVHAVPVVR